MKIAQIAPLAESVPPRFYGGTERIVSYLTEELVAQGHEVTLFASGDSLTSARLFGCAETSLRLNQNVRDALPHNLLMLERVRQRADAFDVLHFHTDLLQCSMLRTIDTPSVTTLHGRLDLPDLVPFYRAFPDLPLVSISDAQRAPMPPVRWVRTIYHGLPRQLYQSSPSRHRGILGVSRPHLTGKASRSGHRDRNPFRHATQDRGKDRQRRSLSIGRRRSSRSLAAVH